MRVPEENELGARSLRSDNDAAEIVVDALEMAVKEEDGPFAVADEASRPQIGLGVVAVPANSLDAGQDDPRLPRGPLEVLHSVAEMSDEIDLGGEAPEDMSQCRDVVV